MNINHYTKMISEKVDFSSLDMSRSEVDAELTELFESQTPVNDAVEYFQQLLDEAQDRPDNFHWEDSDTDFVGGDELDYFSL